MRERPILFSAPMVRAILAGQKTQTRRVLNPQPSSDFAPVAVDWYHPTKVNKRTGEEYPGARVFGAYSDDEGHVSRFAPEDVLWVRETFRLHSHGAGVAYRADEEDEGVRWTPSIFMPRWASRITLEVTGVRVERVKEISKADAEAEGAHRVVPDICERWADGSPVGQHWSMLHPHPCSVDPARGRERCLGSPQMAFANLWISINGRRPGCSWDDNPWIWCVSFRVLDTAERLRAQEADRG